jgi:hypothetical protein
MSANPQHGFQQAQANVARKAAPIQSMLEGRQARVRLLVVDPKSQAMRLLCRTEPRYADQMRILLEHSLLDLARKTGAPDRIEVRAINWLPACLIALSTKTIRTAWRLRRSPQCSSRVMFGRPCASRAAMRRSLISLSRGIPASLERSAAHGVSPRSGSEPRRVGYRSRSQPHAYADGLTPAEGSINKRRTNWTSSREPSSSLCVRLPICMARRTISVNGAHSLRYAVSAPSRVRATIIVSTNSIGHSSTGESARLPLEVVEVLGHLV